MKRGKRVLRKMPQVAILLESSHEASRGRLRGIMKYVRIHGPWRLHIVMGGVGEQRLPILKHWGATGILGRVANKKTAQAVFNTGLPTVLLDPLDEFINSRHEFSQYCRVRCDNQKVGQTAAEYFLKQPFDHFAFVPENNSVNWSRERGEAFAQRITEAGKTVTFYPFSAKDATDWGLECRNMIRWLQKLPKPVAVFTPHDVRGRQVLDACLFAGIKVPYHVAVLSVDNDELICEMTEPPMSSIAVDTEFGGYAAAEILDGLMHGTIKEQKELFYLPGNIVQRASSELLTMDDPIVLKAREFIRINRGLSIRVSDVAKYLKLSRRNIELRFGKILGHSVLEEIQQVRLETIRRLVEQTDKPFNEIALLCGFECISHLGNIFKKEFGITMSEYRKNVQ